MRSDEPGPACYEDSLRCSARRRVLSQGLSQTGIVVWRRSVMWATYKRWCHDRLSGGKARRARYLTCPLEAVMHRLGTATHQDASGSREQLTCFANSDHLGRNDEQYATERADHQNANDVPHAA